MVCRLLFVAVLFSACASGSGGYSNSDSLSAAPNAVTDTLFQDLQVDTFAKLQFDPLFAYVYNRAGADVYEPTPAFDITKSKIIGHLDYKAKVELLSEFISVPFAQQIVVDGLRGYYCLVHYDNRLAWIFSGHLLNLPVPDTTDLEVYFLKTLRLTEPPHQSKTNYRDSSKMRIETKYLFEHGIRLSHITNGKKDEWSLSLPGFSLQQAHLFGVYFLSIMRTHLPVLPEAGVERDITGFVQFTAKDENGELVSVHIVDNEGCGEWRDVIGKSDAGAYLFTGGGC